MIRTCLVGPQLDGAGVAKMETLEEATAQLQRIHGIVERMAMAVRSQQNTTQFGSQIRRARHRRSSGCSRASSA